ncbi:type II toxin-antitoxin system RelE/ParE family toxin [Chroococcus sp. FPU101]|uniref:type II toxin-antitoxin system RelE/ParE family toxin n=1 Tax=Chroococcus sp. FPU101 TaxID=1974212 RepID=UPI001A8E0076|nr:type II toxin-antitoxin system RelE/ParE family toxin [Chroococcus sp. FPU101]GFE71762.1 plasmid stabilization system [Chroococcus sp. FPU101]
MGSYVFSELAVQDLNEICDFISQSNVKAASQLFDVIRQKCKLVADFPNMGKEYDWITSDLRGFVINGYIVFYYPRQDGIDIVRVINGRRDLKALFKEFRDESQ